MFVCVCALFIQVAKSLKSKENEIAKFHKKKKQLKLFSLAKRKSDMFVVVIVLLTLKNILIYTVLLCLCKSTDVSALKQPTRNAMVL